MTTKRGWSPAKRGFEPDVSVHTWTRFMYGYELLAHPALKRLAVAIILQAAAKAKVRIDALAVLDNHVHPFVTQGVVAKKDATREGIFPFTRNWKREVSRRLNMLNIKGAKYEEPYGSKVLHTDAEYVGACGYVMDQAVRHGLDVTQVWVSDAVLRGEADGVMEAVPDLGLDPEATDEERVAWFAELVERTMKEAVRLIGLDKLGEAPEGMDEPSKAGPRPVSPERKAARERLEARRARRAVLDRVKRQELSASYWYEAGAAVLGAVGLPASSEAADRRMIRLGDVFEGYGAKVAELQAYRLPPLVVEERQRESDRRVVETVVSGGGVQRRVVWARRVPEAGPPP